MIARSDMLSDERSLESTLGVKQLCPTKALRLLWGLFLVALTPVRDLLVRAKHLFVAATVAGLRAAMSIPGSICVAITDRAGRVGRLGNSVSGAPGVRRRRCRRSPNRAIPT